MTNFNSLELWFATGSQHLYGPETLQQVASHSESIAQALNLSSHIPFQVKFKPVLTTPDAITQLCLEADASKHCIGIITWMHTFSPSKMWVQGLKNLKKPVLHLHTQHNRDIPWSSIDMDFMNLNQAAHGDREHGFIMSRLRLNRKVVVGFWEDPHVQSSIGTWSRAAAAWHDWQGAKFARLGDNMREVAVTEGDKVSAQIRFGFSVNGYGIGDLVDVIRSVTDKEASDLLNVYLNSYTVSDSLKNDPAKTQSLLNEARTELGLRKFLEQGQFKGFTTTFEDLHGLPQLPGLAAQRLMADGFGFAAEGDWKTSALVRAMKVMATNLPGGTSFMEDYTYHLAPNGMKVLGAHMLEICPSIASTKPSLEVHPLGIGGKSDPARLVFNTPAGPGLNTCLVDMGNRFRLITNTVDVVEPDQPLPKLPVARALWNPHPDLPTSATCWIHAGGAHHTGFSQALTPEHLDDFAEIAGIEHLLIDQHSRIRDFKNELRWNETAYALRHPWGT
jgi:L-arabinose isomerase